MLPEPTIDPDSHGPPARLSAADRLNEFTKRLEREAHKDPATTSGQDLSL